MSAKHPSSDEERQVLADENADIALAVANAMQPRGADGWNILDRMRAELAGTVGGTGFDAHVSGGSTTWCDDHEDENCGCPAMYVVPVRPDRTGNAAVILTSHPDAAKLDIEAWDAAGHRIRMALLDQQRIAVRYLPRPARSSEAALAAEEEATKDPGCESCRRCTRPNGELAWVETYRTGDVRGNLKDQTTARLDKARRLCRACYDEVLLLPAGVHMTLAQALPLRRVRYQLEHGKRARIHDYELQANVQEAS